MEELELLKKNWKNESQFPNFSKKEIFKMIKGKSVSVAKSLLWIGVVEVILWIVFFYFDKESGETFFDLKMILRTVLFVSFILMIIYSYSKINNELSTRKLMKQVLNLRRLILLYIGLMIFSILFFNILDASDSASDALRGFVNGYNNGEKGAKISIDEIQPIMGYFMFGLVFCISMGVLFIIYKNVYGPLLKKLKENYNELTKIESNN